MSLVKNLLLDKATFSDVSEPFNPGNTFGELYKLPGNNKIYFKAGDNGPAHDLTSSSLISSGVLTGGVLSINADATKFDISAGTGVISLHDPLTPTESEITYVSWNAFSTQTVDSLATNLISFIGINSLAEVVQGTTRPTHEDRRETIYLGFLVHDSNIFINDINVQVDYVNEPMAQLRDLYSIIGLINISGNTMSGQASLKIDKSAGTMAAYGANYATNNKDPNIVSLDAIDTNAMGVFQYIMQDGTNGMIISTDVLPDIYDNGTPYPGGTVPVNKFTVQRWYSSTSNNLQVQPGQTIYNSMELAEASILTESFIIAPSIVDSSIFIGYMIVKQSTTDLTDASDAKFIKAGKFGALSGTSGANTLQGVYDISNANPEILTNVSGGALTVRRGSAGDIDNVIEIQNNVGTTVSSITGEGIITATNVISSVADEVYVDTVLTIASEKYHSFSPTTAITVTLPLISTANGYSYTIVYSGGFSTLTIQENAFDSNSIEGVGSIELSELYQHITLTCVNTIWIIG